MIGVGVARAPPKLRRIAEDIMVHRRASFCQTAVALVALACCRPDWSSAFSTAARQQPTVSVLRERTGRSISRTVTDHFNTTVTGEEKKLMAALQLSGRSGDWSRVFQLWCKYSGNAVPVYSAAMHAAYRCGHFEDAAAMYNKLRDWRDVQVDSVVLHQGMKIFGKMRDNNTVAKIWAEAIDTNSISKLLAGARIDAAASMGDVRSAAEVLDYMISHGMNPDVYCFNSAINACRNADPPQPNAAMYLFECMLDRGLEPTVVTFTSLLNSHRLARSGDIRAIRRRMNQQGVMPDEVFAEAFVGTIFKGRVPKFVKETRALIKQMSRSRRRELRDALSCFGERQVMTGLCQQVDKACSG